ncbi:putative ribonuclease-III-like [Lyophyllum shimeji]|uniref:Ribonuclease-III-like n=1 Tax=Lyophyllum shimeji TaxID=47721 RepID=A0A9P3UQA0_LYOSH|nr:putative ribonuclease-III-like [Lyophyllum shimeji]
MMSGPLRRLSSSLSTLKSFPIPSGHPPRGPAARRYSAVALKTRSEAKPRSAPQRISQRGRPRVGYVDEDEGFGSHETPELGARSGETEGGERKVEADATEEQSWNGPRSTWKEPDPRFAEHLNALFPTLQFPPELARRVLTHASHPAAVHGHNAALSFTGRRVLQSYLLLMLSSSPALKPTHDLEAIAERTLNSYTLGQTVGSKWGLGRAMRWTPSLPASQLRRDLDQRELLRSVGLYKIQGDAVGAIMGGIFLQFGGSVAHRVFHTRVLPQLLGRGLPDAFREDALATCERMGGEDGKLVLLDTPMAQTAS